MRVEIFSKGTETIGVHETVIADFHEPGGQDVLKETTDEFQCTEGHSPQSTKRE